MPLETGGSDLASRLVARAATTPARLYHIGRNAVIDLRFGRPLALGYIRNKKQSSSDYAVLERIFEGRFDPDDVLVDLGSGPGRVISQWLRMGHRGRIYGVERDATTAEAAARRFRGHENVEIIPGDAADHLPANGTLFYFFNPFDRPTTVRVADAIAQLPQSSSPVRVLYFSCKHVDVFDEDDRFDVVLEVIDHPWADDMLLAVITHKT